MARFYCFTVTTVESLTQNATNNLQMSFKLQLKQVG